MRVALGTIEITDEQRRAIYKSLGHRGGYIKRDDAKAWALELINEKIASLTNPPAATDVPVADDSDVIAESEES